MAASLQNRLSEGFARRLQCTGRWQDTFDGWCALDGAKRAGSIRRRTWPGVKPSRPVSQRWLHGIWRRVSKLIARCSGAGVWDRQRPRARWDGDRWDWLRSRRAFDGTTPPASPPPALLWHGGPLLGLLRLAALPGVEPLPLARPRCLPCGSIRHSLTGLLACPGGPLWVFLGAFARSPVLIQIPTPRIPSLRATVLA